MGYTCTISAVNMMRSYLEVLRTTSMSQVRWPAKNTKTLVYQLHRALASAEALDVPGYKTLKIVWQIKTKGNYVIAAKRVQDTPEISVEDVADSIDIIGILAQNKDVESVFTFPHIPDMDSLLSWAKENNVDINITKTKIRATWKSTRT